MKDPGIPLRNPSFFCSLCGKLRPHKTILFKLLLLLTVFTFNFSAFEGSAAQRPKIVKIN
ncbi:MAG: hypothetical protein LBS83_00955 [Holosporales bacterium]|nr:hypothetical protein [Holosporales bacterium]